jgi:hypothetical protein
LANGENICAGCAIAAREVMMDLTATLVIWFVGALLGSMLFFAVAVAPTVFNVLTATQAGVFLRAFFPHYYLWGLVFALIAAAIAMSANAAASGVLLLVALLFVFARQVLMPHINRARDEELMGLSGAARRFKLLHLWSVLINVFQMLILLVAAFLLYWTG